MEQAAWLRPPPGVGDAAASTPLCCLVCPLRWGVKVISLFTLASGLQAVLLLTVPEREGHGAQGYDVHRQPKDPVELMWSLANAMGVVAGMAGLRGVRTGEPWGMVWLCAYYIMRIVMQVLLTADEWLRCRVPRDFRAPGDTRPLTCQEARDMLLPPCLLLLLMQCCFFEAIFNLLRQTARLAAESPSLAAPELRQRLLANAVMAPLPQLTMDADRSSAVLSSIVAGSLPLPAVAGGRVPRQTRQGLHEGHQIFGGTPYRLE